MKKKEDESKVHVHFSRMCVTYVGVCRLAQADGGMRYCVCFRV